MATRTLQTTIGALEKRIVVQHRANQESKRLQTIPGIGPIGASAIAAIGDEPKDLPIWT
jgi:transposase